MYALSTEMGKPLLFEQACVSIAVNPALCIIHSYTMDAGLSRLFLTPAPKSLRYFFFLAVDEASGFEQTQKDSTIGSDVDNANWEYANEAY